MNDWTVRNTETGKEWHVDSRSEGEERIDDVAGLHDPEDFKIIPPNKATDGGTKTVEPEVVDNNPESEGYDLPDKPRVDQDPLTWMPDEFTDTVDGSVCINRKGFEVLCQHFGVSIKPEVEVSPHETDFEYAQCRAVATTEDGTEYVAYGSAHVDRGDDKGVLLEMSDTRSYKRAASRATGVGMLAVEEIQNEVRS